MFIKQVHKRRFINPKAQQTIENYVSLLQQNLYIPIEGGVGKYDKDRAVYDEKKQRYHFRFKPEDVHGIILYPSLCTPSVIEPGAPLTVFYVINEAQMKNIRAGVMIKNPDSPYQVSRLFAYNLWAQLHCTRWHRRHQFRPTPRFKMDYRTAKRLFKTLAEVSTNMLFNEPKAIDPAQALLLEDAKGHIVGRVKPDAVRMYHEKGYRYLVRVTYRDHNLTKPGLYNLSFISLETRAQVLDAPGPLSPFQDHQDLLAQETIAAYRSKITHKYKIPVEGEFKFALDENDPVQTFHPIYVVDKPKLGVGHLTDVHVSSRQHGFQQCNLQVIPGAPESLSPPLGKIINTSYDSLKDLMDQMGNNSKVDLLFITGDLVDYSLNWDLTGKLDEVGGFAEIWKEMGLAKSRRNKNLSSEKSKTTQTIDPKNRLEQTHAYGIDNTIIYSLFIYYYDRYKKPIFITSGNHDAYELPYGISPRVGPEKVNAGIPMDHNLTFHEAILLFGKEYHTVLSLFDKGGDSTWKWSNFVSQYSHWLYHVFTPLSDFSFDYKQQTFTGLEWGDDEELFTSLVKSGGVLPRAPQGLDDNQQRILQDACLRQEAHQGDNMLFLHPTIVNYASDIPLFCADKEDLQHIGKLTFNSQAQSSSNYSKYNEGSFGKNRQLFFENFIANNKLTHTFSGHSHRSVVYECVSHYRQKHPAFSISRPGDVSHHVQAIGYPMDLSLFPGAQARDKYLFEFLNSKKTRIVVTGCGGPIPIQNIQQELGGEGLCSPTGTVLYANDKGQEIMHAIYAKNKTAKARFAVALDAFNVKGENWVFQIKGHNARTHLDPSQWVNRFSIEINKKLPKPMWIKKMTLFVMEQKVEEEEKEGEEDKRANKMGEAVRDMFGKEGVELSAEEEMLQGMEVKQGERKSLTIKGRASKKTSKKTIKTCEVKFSSALYDNYKSDLEFIGDFPMIHPQEEWLTAYGFLCVELTPIDEAPYKHYDFSTPWIVYVQLRYERLALDGAPDNWSLKILRDAQYGEAPNFAFYKQYYKGLPTEGVND